MMRNGDVPPDKAVREARSLTWSFHFIPGSASQRWYGWEPGQSGTGEEQGDAQVSNLKNCVNGTIC